MLLPQILTQFPEMIEIMQSMRTMMLTMHSSMSGVFNQMDDSNSNSTGMGKAFDTAKDDDTSTCRRPFSRMRTSNES